MINGHDDDLTRPPGLIGMLVDHGERCTPTTTRTPALAGSLVGFATVTRNQYAVRIGAANHIPLNLYFGLIGETGDGKETAFTVASSAAEIADVSGSAFASPEGLHNAFTKDKTQLLLMDEWGRALQQIKADKAGHARGVMTKAMEVYGAAIGGSLKARHYANSKNNLPAVKHPYMCALLATTPRTLVDALTSGEVVDGSLNRVPIATIEPQLTLRPLDQIHTGPIPEHLVQLIRRASAAQAQPTGEPRAANGYVEPVKARRFQGEQTAMLGTQAFKIIAVEPGALAIFAPFRQQALERKRADQKLGALWARAFEHAVRLAGNVAVGVAVVNWGRLLVTAEIAAWATEFVTWAIESTCALLRHDLADSEGERVRLRIEKHAANLRDAALDEPDPPVEHAAPADVQQTIRDLKLNGWFPKRELIRCITGGGGFSSRDVEPELRLMVAAERLLTTTVSWKTARGSRTHRDFMTWAGGA
jgi:hypothetical protein